MTPEGLREALTAVFGDLESRGWSVTVEQGLKYVSVDLNHELKSRGRGARRRPVDVGCRPGNELDQHRHRL